MRFDLSGVIFNDKKFVIEPDGAQHFDCKSYWNYNPRESLQHKRERDITKHKLCVRNNIHVLRIGYKAFHKKDILKDKAKMKRIIRRFFLRIRKAQPNHQITQYIGSHLYQNYISDLNISILKDNK